MRFLLDTNTWIALLRWQDAGVLAGLKKYSTEEILLCSVVVGELWYGAEHGDVKRREENYALVDGLEARYQSVPFDNHAAREYAVIRAELARIGQPIGPNDTMIAAIARSRGTTLVTHNTREFRRVAGLSLVDWQAS